MPPTIREDHKALYRFDVAELDQATKSRTPEGYIRVTARVARSGIQEYPDGLGGVMKELRHPDDVFSQDALQSLTMLPVSNLHPPEFLTPKNVRKHQVGFSGENVTVDGKWIKIPIVVMDETAIKDVEEGRRELSVGYTVDLLEEAGTYDGQPYTHRQTNIRGNHIALVDRARAGKEARINLDGGKLMDQKLVTVVIDGIDYQASPEVSLALNKAKDALTQALADKDKSKALTDALQAKFDELTKERDELKAKLDTASDPKTIDALVTARLDLLTKALSVVKDGDFTGKSDREVMEAVVKARHADLDLKDKSDAYVQARFDAVVETVKSEPARKQRELTRPVVGNEDTGTIDLDKIRKETLDSIYGRHLKTPGLNKEV